MRLVVILERSAMFQDQIQVSNGDECRLLLEVG